MKIQCRLKFPYNDNQYCGIKTKSIKDLNNIENLQKKSITRFSFAVIVC